MSQKLENSLRTFKDSVSQFINSIKEIDTPPKTRYEILVLNRQTRNCKRQSFFQMKDAMSSVHPEYLYDTDNEYFLVNTCTPEHKCIKLNKLDTHGKNERSLHTSA
jgi:hypothetical protein